MSDKSGDGFFQRMRLLRRAWLRTIGQAYREEQVRAMFPGASIGSGVIIRRPERFYPGKSLEIHDRAYLNCAGGDWNGGAGFIKLGDNCEIGPYAVLWGAGGITMGDDVHIGDHVSMTAHEGRHMPPDKLDVFAPMEFDFEPIVVGDHVIICPHANVIPGVRIGHHAMVAPGAVVIRDVPDYALVAGVPAKVVRELDPNAGREIGAAAKDA